MSLANEIDDRTVEQQYGKCPCTLLVPSEELRQIYEKAGVTP